MNFFQRLVRQREFVIFIIVLAVVVAMSFASPIFLTEGNILALLLSLSIQSVMAVGMVNLMVGGGFDMSVGSILGFTGIIVAMIMKAGVPITVSNEVCKPGSLASLARPKSMTLIWPFKVSIRFSGLMSRWTIPAAWAVSRPWAAWVMSS